MGGMSEAYTMSDGTSCYSVRSRSGGMCSADPPMFHLSEPCNSCGKPLCYERLKCINCGAKIYSKTPIAEEGHPFPHNHPS